MKRFFVIICLIVGINSLAQDKVEKLMYLYRTHKYEQAVQLADELVQTQPNDSTFLAYAAYAHYEHTAQGSPSLKERENTLAAIEAALEAKNDKKELYLRLANTAYDMSRSYNRPEEVKSILKFKGYVDPDYRKDLQKLALKYYEKYLEYDNSSIMAVSSLNQRINELEDDIKFN